jgi:hypothetical protein
MEVLEIKGEKAVLKRELETYKKKGACRKSFWGRIPVKPE